MGHMSIFDWLRPKTGRPGVEIGSGLSAADCAILDAHQGRISAGAMLESILRAQVLVPLAEPPLINGSTMQWKPATVTRQSDGQPFLAVFTNEAAARAYSQTRPEYSHCLKVDAQWVLDVLPPGHGILFNLGTENGFGWPASGIAEFQADRSV
jgi:hypothetical protein